MSSKTIETKNVEEALIDPGSANCLNGRGAACSNFGKMKGLKDLVKQPGVASPQASAVGN